MEVCLTDHNRRKDPSLEGPKACVIDQWRLIEKLKESTTGEVSTNTQNHRFDLDRYKILRTYITRNQSKIALVKTALI